MELRECPFCGGKAHMAENVSVYEAASRMEVHVLCHPIRVQVWVTEPMTTVTTHSQIIKDFTGVRDYLAWLESEYDDGAIVFKEDE